MAINLDDVQPNVVTADLSNKIWLFYGEMATRKTSVACSFPRHLLIATDIGYKMINGAMPALISSWQDFKAIVRQLNEKKNRERFDVIIIDTIGQLYQMCYMYMLTQMGVDEPGQAGAFGTGWKRIRNEFETTVRSIPQKGYGLILLAHSDEVEKEDKVTKQKVSTIKIDIDKRPDLIIKGLADFVFFLHKEEDEHGNPTVYAYTNLVGIDTKTRSRFFTPKFEFTYENLQDEMTKAVDRQYEFEGRQKPTNCGRINYYASAETEVNFENLRQQVVNQATELMNSGCPELETTLLNIFKGAKLSELVESQDTVEKLQVASATLEELKERFGTK